MKPILPVLLGLSLAANTALYLARPRATPSATTHSTLPEKTAASGSSAATSPSAPGLSAVSSEIWELIKAGDPTGVARLRALGFPERAIRALVIAQLNDLFRAREKAVGPDPAKAQFWKSNYNRSLYTPQDRLAAIDLRREKSALLKQLLGPDFATADQTYTDPSTAGLTPEKIERLRWINEDFSALTAEIRGDEPSGLLLPEEREKLLFLEKEKRADLAQLLTPDELRAYDLRNSNTASSLRYQLNAFEPTEAEFLAIYEAQKPLDDRVGLTFGRQSRAERDARQKAQLEIDAQIKKTLSPERYADYERSKDYNYTSLYDIGTQLQLPKATLVAAYDVRKALETKMNSAMRSFKPEPGVSPADIVRNMNETRAALAREGAAQMIQILGQPAFDRYKASNGWRNIDYVIPVPTPAPTKG